MPIGGNYFIYNGVASRTYGLMFAYVNTTNQNAAVEGTREYLTSKLPRGDRYMILGRQPDGPYACEVEIISETPLTAARQRELVRWLFYRPDYAKLKILSPEYEGVYYSCILTDETAIMAGDGCHGWKCTLQCDSGFAWEEPKTAVYENLVSGSIIEFENTSDEIGYLKPDVTLTVGDCDTVQIQNVEDNNNMVRFEQVAQGYQIHMDEWGQITGTPESVHWYGRYNHRRLFLVNGVNHLAITGEIARLEIAYQNKRRIGL